MADSDVVPAGEGNLLSAIAHPADPMTAAGNMLNLFSGVQQYRQGQINLQMLQRDFAAKQAMANAYQQFTDPTTGNVDQAGLLAATGGPAAAWAAPQERQAFGTQQQEVQKGTQEALATKLKQRQAIANALNPQLKDAFAGNPVPVEELRAGVDNLVKTKVITQAEADDVEQQLAGFKPGQDAKGVLLGWDFANSNAEDYARAAMTGMQQTNLGGRVSNVQQLPGLAGPAVPSQQVVAGPDLNYKIWTDMMTPGTFTDPAGNPFQGTRAALLNKFYNIDYDTIWRIVNGGDIGAPSAELEKKYGVPAAQIDKARAEGEWSPTPVAAAPGALGAAPPATAPATGAPGAAPATPPVTGAQTGGAPPGRPSAPPPPAAAPAQRVAPGQAAQNEHNNFANIKTPGAGPGGPEQHPENYPSFPTPVAGVSAIATQLTRYMNGQYSRSPINTVAGIVSTWSPASDGNDTKRLINDAATYMGVKPNQPLDPNDHATMRKLTEAMIRNEQGQVPPEAQAGIDQFFGTGGGAAAPAARPPLPPLPGVDMSPGPTVTELSAKTPQGMPGPYGTVYATGSAEDLQKDYAASQVNAQKAYQTDQQYPEQTKAVVDGLQMLKNIPNLQTGPGAEWFAKFTSALRAMGAPFGEVANAANIQDLAKNLAANQVLQQQFKDTDLSRIAVAASQGHMDMVREGLQRVLAEQLGFIRLQSAQWRFFQQKYPGQAPELNSPQANMRLFNSQTGNFRRNLNQMALGSDHMSEDQIQNYTKGLSPGELMQFATTQQWAKQAFPDFTIPDSETPLPGRPGAPALRPARGPSPLARAPAYQPPPVAVTPPAFTPPAASLPWQRRIQNALTGGF